MTAILMICVTEKPESPGKGISTETTTLEPSGCTPFELKVITAFEASLTEWLSQVNEQAKQRAAQEPKG